MAYRYHRPKTDRRTVWYQNYIRLRRGGSVEDTYSAYRCNKDRTRTVLVTSSERTSLDDPMAAFGPGRVNTLKVLT